MLWRSLRNCLEGSAARHKEQSFTRSFMFLFFNTKEEEHKNIRTFEAYGIEHTALFCSALMNRIRND